MSQTSVFTFKQLKNEKSISSQCLTKIEAIKQKLNSAFSLNPNKQCYVQIDINNINTFLFALFGQISMIEKNSQIKKQYQRISGAHKARINNIIQSDFSFKKIESKAGKIQIDKIKRKQQQFQQKLNQLLQVKQIWNKFTHKQLSDRYHQTYFNLWQLKGYKDWKIQSNKQRISKKYIVVLPIKQERIQQKNRVILCFLTATKPFTVDEIDELLQEYRQDKREKNADNKLQSQRQRQRKNSKGEDKKNQVPLMGSCIQIKFEGQSEAYFGLNLIQIFWIVVIMILITLVVDSLGTGYSEMDRGWDNLNIMERDLVQAKVWFDQSLINPLLDHFDQVFKN